jgi:N-acetylmuramoyl-L-alanine amidase
MGSVAERDVARTWSLAALGLLGILTWNGWAIGEMPPSSGGLRLVLDPGHGGKETGARGPGGVLEKEVALTLARELREEARSMGGFQVRLTREEDETFPWVRRRGAGAGAELWVSIHLNADLEGKARGPRVFYAQTGLSEEPGRDANDKEKKGSTDVGAILQDMTRTKWENESVLLAEHLQRALDAAWGLGSRASRPAPIPGFRDLECPAVLMEVGFLTNQADLKALSDPGRRRQLVKAILKGVRSFLQDPRRSH